jgi:DNA-binding transcriptional MerR regulator/methylmalonyl-CoA mutase cobalamin-binding subunit
MSVTTPIYNLKAVIHETGLSPETLRAWERRYGLLKPQRSPGGHRLYSQYDIDMLQWLVARQKEGLSISRAVEMWRSLEKAGQDPLQQHFPQGVHAPQVALKAGGTTLDDLRRGWVEGCLTFDEQSAEWALAQAFAIAAPEIVCTEVLQKGLADIGEGWYQGEISVQQEHFASALAMRRIDALIAAAPPATRPGRFLAANPPGEEHDFGLLLITYLLRRRGWEVAYLGANVPLNRLAATLQLTSPRLVLAVAQTLNSAASLRDMADALGSHRVPLAYGGGIFNLYPAITRRIPGYFLGTSIADVPQVVERLLSRLPPLAAIPPLPPEYTRALEKFVEQEALIVGSVTQAFQSDPIEPDYLDIANTNFTRGLVSALVLGDIHLLDHAAGWLEGLLENYGLSPALAGRYFAAFRQAVQQHLAGNAGPILDWLARHAE